MTQAKLVPLKRVTDGSTLFEARVPCDDPQPARTALAQAAKSGFVSFEALDLSGEDLSGADLSGLDLSWVYFRGANLSRANLSRANLTRAYLGHANLADATLSQTTLTRAVLSFANLTGANLADADLAQIRLGLENVLAASVADARSLLMALYEGRVNASVDPFLSVPSRGQRYEGWFSAILHGDTPESNQVAAITVGWVRHWLATRAGSRTLPTA